MKNLIEDKKAKTKAFFFKNNSAVLDKKIINFLEKYYRKNKKDIRVCLHSNPKDKHHDMVLLQKKKTFSKHGLKIKKWELFLINI